MVGVYAKWVFYWNSTVRNNTSVCNDIVANHANKNVISDVEMIRKNEDKLKKKFSDLLIKVEKALQAKNNIHDVRRFLTTFFKCDFSRTSDLEEMFSTVTLKELWDYQNHSPVEELADHFLQGDQEVVSLIRDYKARLTAFCVTTKLIDYVEYKNITAEDSSDEESDWSCPPKFDKSQFRKIKVVLKLDRKVSELSLNYVHQLWRSFAEEYDIPSLTAVLDRVFSGSLIITWKVPSHLAEQVVPRSKFFRKNNIVLVYIDNIVIYDEREMVSMSQS